MAQAVAVYSESHPCDDQATRGDVPQLTANSPLSKYCPFLN
jgi:hypothetical protein